MRMLKSSHGCAINNAILRCLCSWVLVMFLGGLPRFLALRRRHVLPALALATCAAAPAALAVQFADWATVHNDRYGFSIAYPSAYLFPVKSRDDAEGRVMQSADGKAKLLVASFQNVDNLTLDGYRDFLLSDVYANAKIDYAPQKPRWFVLSGERGEEGFYERVTFSCAGRLINSWAMLYPMSERRFYERMLDAIARTYSAGSGPDGQCNFEGDPAAPPGVPAGR